MIVLIDGVRYQLVTPKDEPWLENVIETNSEHIFGPDSFYFNIKKLIKSKAGVASIPDGYAIYFTPKPRWAIIEVELVSHQIDRHIIPQLNRFNRAIEDNATRRQLVEDIFDIFNEDEILKIKLKQKIQSGEVHKFISDLIFQKPLIIVVIDQKTDKLEEALRDIRGDVRVIEFKTFRREGISDDVNAFVFEPLGTKVIIEPPGREYSEFWEPIRRDGLFKGKPVPVQDEGWISKGIRGMSIELVLRDHRCFVQLLFKGEDRLKRRKKIMELFPKTEYEYTLRESKKAAKVWFRVLEKGKKDREDWPEIREKLTKLGTDIYNKIKESGV